MIKFEQILKDISQMVETQMDELLPKAKKTYEAKLVDAMKYSCLSPGKRIRPFLAITSSSLFGVSTYSSLRAASAVEFVHAYSLIHDDLPALDNDVQRRGQASCHIKFDEATAILAGDALLTLAFEVLSDNLTHPDSSVRCELVSSLAKAIGYNGMVGGQMLDIISQEKSLSINEITRMQRMKTGELFAVSCEFGAILGKASKNLRMALRGYAFAIGLAFQIVDDILDFKQDASRDLHKKTATNFSYISEIGVEKSYEQVKMLITQAISHLNVFEEKADPLRNLAKFIIDRKN